MYDVKVKHVLKVGNRKSRSRNDFCLQIACEVWPDEYDYESLLNRPVNEAAAAIRRVENDLSVVCDEFGNPVNINGNVVTLHCPVSGVEEVVVNEPKGSTLLIEHPNFTKERLLVAMDLVYDIPETLFEDFWIGDLSNIFHVYENFLV